MFLLKEPPVIDGPANKQRRNPVRCSYGQLMCVNTSRIVVRMLSGWHERESVMKRLVLAAIFGLIDYTNLMSRRVL